MANKKEIIKRKKGEVIKEAQISKKGDSNSSKGNTKREAGIIIILMTMVLLLILLFFLHWNLDDGDFNSTNKTPKDFKEEYERLNGKKDKDGNSYLNVSIDLDNVIQYANYNKIFSLLERGTGVIYFGAPDFPWCRAFVPVLLDAADEVGIDTIYYLNLSSDRDQKELNDDFEIITTKEGSKDYQSLLEKLHSVLDDYEGLEDESIQRIYFPTVIFVKDGEITSTYLGSSTFEEGGFQKLDEEETEVLRAELMRKMNQVITCDDAC